MNKFKANIILFLFLFLTLNVGMGQDHAKTLIELIESQRVIKLHENAFFPMSLFVDSHGFLWAGLRQSLVKFDGVDYEEYYHHPDQNTGMLMSGPQIIKEDKSGNIWIGSWTDGVSRIDNLTGEFTHFKANPKDTNSIYNNAISDILITEDSTVWISTKGFVLHRFNQEEETFSRFQCKIPHHESNGNSDVHFGRMAQDHLLEEKIWIANKYGLTEFDIKASEFKHHEIPYVIPQHYGEWTRPIHADDIGQIWYGHYNGGGIKVFDISDNKWTQTITTDSEHGYELGRTRMINIYPYNDSLVLGMSYLNHFYLINKFKPDEYSILPYTPSNMNCLGFYVDNEKQVWVGMQDQILLLNSKPNPFKYFSFSPMLGDTKKGNFQQDILFDSIRQKYYISTRGGDGVLSLNRSLDEMEIFRYKSREGWSNVDLYFKALINQNDTIWASSEDGLFYIDVESKEMKPGKSIPDDLQERMVGNTLEDNDDQWLAYLSGGISRFSFKDRRLINYSDDSLSIMLPNTIISRIAIWNDKLLLATKEGLILYDPHLNKKMMDWVTAPCLGMIMDFPINDIEIENDTIWAASKGNGLVKLVFKNGVLSSCNKFSSSQSIGTNVVHQIVRSRAGEIWLGNNFGISKYNRSNNTFQDYGRLNGLGFDIRDGLFTQLETGEIIGGSNAGIKYFFPSEVDNIIDIPEPYLKSISVLNTEIRSESKSTKVHRFEASDDHLSFEMGGINFNNSSKNYYKYQLEGYDKNWIDNGENRRASYTNLPGGNYIFKFSVSPSGRDWSEVNSTSIFVETAFVDSWIFKLIIGLLVLGFLGLIYFYRVNQMWSKNLILAKDAQLVKLSKERIEAELSSLRSQMNPHFLFNSLNSIKWYILKEKPQEASMYLSKFSKLMRQILDFSKKEMITLNEEIECVKLYVELENMRFENPFDFTLNIDKKIDSYKTLIPPLIIQPFVENAIWHGLSGKKGERELEIDISNSTGSLSICIRDNGIGRKATEKQQSDPNHKSKGIKITTKRLSAISLKGHQPIEIVDLISKKGHALGTLVKINIQHVTNN